MKSLVEPGARNTESQRGGRSGNGGHVVWNREIDAARVLQIVAGDDLEHQSGVLHMRLAVRLFLGPTGSGNQQQNGVRSNSLGIGSGFAQAHDGSAFARL